MGSGTLRRTLATDWHLAEFRFSEGYDEVVCVRVWLTLATLAAL